MVTASLPASVPRAEAAVGDIVEYPVGAPADRPEGIAHGPDGNLWVAQRAGNRIDRLSPTGTVTRFALPTRSAGPSRITAGPDGALWFTETSANKIGRITTSGAVTEFPVPTANSQPLGIVAGADGALWFVEQSSSRIGRITVTGAVTEFRLSTGVAPAEITNGPDGNLYFTERSGNRIGRVSPATGAITEFAPVPTAAGGLAGIATGPDGALWFTERNADKVGRITLGGVVSEFPVAVPGARKVGPMLLTAGPDDALWVTGFDASAVLRVATDGAVQSFRTPSSGSAPAGITVGPGFDLWFTENGTGKVGRVTPAAKPRSVANLVVTAEPAAAAAGHQRTPANGIDPAELTDTALLQGGLLRASPLASSPLASSPLASSPLASSPLASSPLASSPLASSELAPTLLSAIPLASSPLGSSGWGDVLAGTRYDGVPLQTVTLGDVFDLAALDPVVAQRLAVLTLAHLPLASSPLASSSLAAVLLGTVALGSLPPPAGGWCGFLVGQPLDCSNGVTLGATTLLSLELAGDDLSAYYARQIDLSQAALVGAGYAAPLAFVRLVNLNLAATPFGPLSTALVPSLVTCPAGGCAPTLAEARAAGQVRATATVADALALGPVRDLHMGLGSLIAGMIPPWQLPYEDGPLSAILDQALLRDFDLLLYTAAFDLSCAQPAGLEVAFAFPDGFRARPGTATLTVDGAPAAALPAPTVAGGTHRWAVPTGGPGQPCPAGATATGGHRLGLSVEVEPSAVLGAYAATVSASTALDRGTGQAAEATAPLRTADDSHDTDDRGDPAAAQAVETDTLYAAHLSSAGDVDTYSVVAPPAGSLRVTLSHLPADYDLVVFGPNPGLATSPDRSSPLASSPLASSPLGSSPLGSSPLGSSPLPDDSGQAGVGDDHLAPNTLQDVPLGSSPLASSGLLVRGVSARRDTATESVTVPLTAADRGQRFVIQVSGFNAAWSPQPYVLRAAAQPGAAPLACATPTLVGTGAPGPFPSTVAPTTRSLFLVNAKGMGDLYGPAATGQMLDALGRLAGRPEVAGVVVAVESDPTVPLAGALAARAAEPCSVPRANAVVSGVNAVVDHVRAMGAGLPELRHIVLVGPDDVLPQARVPDLVRLSNETEYGREAAVGGMDTGVSRALGDGFLLTDDPYGDFDPQPWLSGQLFVPDVALGRLVESPADVLRAVGEYERAGGVLDPQSATVFGYDFMTDGAQAMAAALAGPSLPTAVRTDGWAAADARAATNAAAPGVVAVNAHYNHWESLPAQAFADGTADLFTTGQLSPAARSLLITMGCHGGLNVPDIGVATPTPAQRTQLLDWPQAAGNGSALYAGNTGFGYGDTEVVAYSERLLELFSANLASRAMTAAQALMYAKQAYRAELGVAGVYDAKILEISTFYGLPMWRLGAGGGEAAPALPAHRPAPGGPADLRSSTFSVTPSLTRVDTDRGSFWQADGQDPVIAHFRPVQPRLALDVTAADGLPVHGVLVESLVSEDVAGVDPVYARPTIDLAANEPERSASTVWFPAQPQAVHSTATPAGRSDRLVLMPGQFRADGSVTGAGTQRLHRQIEGTVYRSASDDWWAPHIERVRGQVVNGGATFEVRTPATDVVRGVVLWRDDTGPTWHRTELLASGAGRWSGGTLLAAGATRVTEFTVQLLDGSGNVAASTNKGPGYVAGPADGGGAGLTLSATPAPGPSGYASAPVTVTVAGIPTGHTATVTVDDGEPFAYTGPFTVGEGIHVVRALLDDGTRSGALPVAVDTTAPVATPGVTPAPNAAGWHNQPATVSFDCADATAGVAGCPDDVTLAADGAGQTVTRTVTDRVGLSTTVTAGPVNVDRTAPVVSATVMSTPGTGGWLQAATVRFTCTDATSGVASCPADVVVPDGSGQVVSGTAVDVAGNASTVTVGGLDVDAGDPELTVTVTPSPNGAGWNRSDAGVDFTCTDALSGVASCTGDTTVTGETAGRQVTGTAVDRAGNTATMTVTVRIDTTAPDTSVDRPRLLIVNIGEPVKGGAVDALSGVASVQVTYRGLNGSRTHQVPCVPSGGGGGGGCTWSDPNRPVGVFIISAAAVDAAGNTDGRPAELFNVILL